MIYGKRQHLGGAVQMVKAQKVLVDMVTEERVRVGRKAR